jgi:hypothetical protein
MRHAAHPLNPPPGEGIEPFTGSVAGRIRFVKGQLGQWEYETDGWGRDRQSRSSP